MEPNFLLSNATPTTFPKSSQVCGGESEGEFRVWDLSPSFTISVIILSLILIVNGGVLFSTLRNKPRPLSCMIAHLAFVCIFAAVSNYLWVLGLDKTFKELWICCLFSYTRNMSVNLISLSVASISYEMLQSLVRKKFRIHIVPKLIGLIWLVSALGALPSLFTSTLALHVTPCGQIHSMCMKTSPFDNFYLGVVYEVCRTSFFHLGVSIYLLYDLLKVRSKLETFYKFAKKIEGLRKKMRVISINLVAFILLWVPFGALLGFYKNTVQSKRHAEFKEKGFEAEREYNEKSLSFYFLFFFFYTYILLMPLILSFCTNDNLFKKRKAQTSGGDGKSKLTQNGDTTQHLSSSSSSNSLEMEQSLEANWLKCKPPMPPLPLEPVAGCSRDCNQPKMEEFPNFLKETLV